jgi:uncharacterized protein (DUF488 family)
VGSSAQEVATGEQVDLFTIGHSTHPIDAFLKILNSHGIERLADIRTVPRSRHNPQFNRENLPASLDGAGIRYVHMPGLGGLRMPRKDSINTGWRNDSFRGYADYMQTDEFERRLEELIALAGKERVAIMCAESVPWRCHRSLVADALTARGVTVRHIMAATSARAHTLTPFAHIEAHRVTYPGLPVMTME